MAKEKIIGIDLGTSNSAAAVLEGSHSKIVPSAEGASLYGKAFPSVVAFSKDGHMLVGEAARRQAISNPEGTVMAAKRKMGTKFSYDIHGKKYTPQQISAFILQKIKRDAESFLGTKINKAVITVPAYFDDNQRQATKDAGKIAGLDVVRIINEPTAAALAYGLGKGKEDQKILVFDFGGGTLDVTIMEFGDGVFEVKATSGDTQLGGTDMDNALINHIVEEFKSKESIDLNEDAVAMQRVREAAEKAKIELSTVVQTDINLPFVIADSNGPKNLAMTITRSQLEKIVLPIVQQCKKSIDQALADAKLTANDIRKIVLVGGPTRMPIVQQEVEKWLGSKAERGIDPMECVAQGAAIQGGVLAGDVKDVLLLDVTPLSLGIETLGGVFTHLIERNTTIPVKRSQVFSTAADNQPAVTIRISQGERPMFADNKMLGQFDLVGIPPAPRGVPKIEVTFDINANGILNVKAKDQGTGKEQSIKITAPHKLDKSDIERMKAEAEKFAEEDQKRKESIETINNADALVYATENSLKDFKGKVADKDVKPIEEQVAALKKLLAAKDKDVPAIKSATDDLQKTTQAAASKLYEAAQKTKQAGAKNSKTAADEKVVDAEFKEKSKSKGKA